MKRVISWLLDLLYPPKCVICRRLLAAGETEICADCLEALPNFEGPAPQVDGCDVRQYPLETLRRKIGLVPQSSRIRTSGLRTSARAIVSLCRWPPEKFRPPICWHNLR